tara:strand:+ start:542 stop:679 length:138 start_codon:yes stop_codon:yes gene_type:complete
VGLLLALAMPTCFTSSAIEFGLMLNDHWLTMDPAIVIQLEYHHTP